MIQYVYERYGREHAAMTAEVITYRTRSAIRDTGKALGLSLAQVDAIAKEYDAAESLAVAAGTEPEAEQAMPVSIAKRRDLDASSNVRASRGYYPPGFGASESFRLSTTKNVVVEERSVAPPISGPMGALLLALCRRLDGFPRHMGIHSGGMVLTRDPLIRVAPVEWATMRDRTIIQWDKDDLADLGLIKIDLLGLGMLSLLRDAFNLYRRRYGEEMPPLALATIPADDKPTYAMLQKADSIGVFQVESRAQQSMLPRMKPVNFYDIRHASRNHPAGPDSRAGDDSTALCQRGRAQAW